MKRFEFSLESLLKVKRQVERLAELEQLRAREAVDRARVRLDEFREQLARISDRFTASIGRPMAPQQWTTASDMSERLAESIRIAEQDVATAEEKLLAASQERARVAAEVEALETLRQEQWDKWRQEVQQADQGRLDEVGMRRWMSARAAEGIGSQGSS